MKRPIHPVLLYAVVAILFFLCGRYLSDSGDQRNLEGIEESYAQRLNHELDSLKFELTYDDFNAAYESGYDLGYYEGFNSGSSDARMANDNYKDGYEEGYSLGYDAGYYDSYENSEDEFQLIKDGAYSVAYDEGYNEGYKDGRKETRADYIRQAGAYFIGFIIILITSYCLVTYSEKYFSTTKTK